MAHNNVSIFVAHVGCPNLCSFCNQHTISGNQSAPTVEEVRATCLKAFNQIEDKSSTEIAFFGGSFTAIERSYMVALLDCVQEYIGKDGFLGVRISTRPDCITSEILDILKEYHVTAIELGCQSMKDDVLSANRRGHTAQDVYNSCELIKSYGFELGLQMMVGLYTSTILDEYYTMNEIIKLNPNTVRIYPTVVLKGTHLDELRQSGEYNPYDLDTMVNICADFLTQFSKHNINVIKCGLHASELVESEMTGGYYHPAFRELCESRIYRNIIEKIIKENENKSNNVYNVSVSSRYISMAIGQKKSNIVYFKDKGIIVSILGVDNLNKYDCILDN
ncbi:MAG: radical SAM protein [Ruminococcus sp.]|nr:radical SAM protein [Ruminococcus sp.]MCD7799947.1 radical SAM protein [Ruminococcus sp.]